MDNPKCDACGAPMKRNGKTKSGAQRWRCKGCGASSTHHIDNSAKQLKAFLKWLMGKQTIEEAASCSKATFERRTERFWRLWPLSSYTGEVHDVVFVDGIYVTRKLVVLIASTRRQNVLAWHLAESECSEAWAALLLRCRRRRWRSQTAGAGSRRLHAPSGRTPRSRGAWSTSSAKWSGRRR